MERLDCVVIGAGVVGLACARSLALAGREVVVLEANAAIGMETSSRNSEVIHAGLYYPPGSLKARLCIEGKHFLYRYCAERGVPHRRLGKIIVATDDSQLAVLEDYRRKALAVGVPEVEMLSAADVGRLEPEVKARAALLSSSTGIIDSHALMLAYQADLEANGGMVVCHSPVVGASAGDNGIVLVIGGDDGTSVRCRSVVNAAGLDAQAIAGLILGDGHPSIPKRHLAKGSYFTLAGRSPFSRLVYPVAVDGGLGVHATLDMGGQVRFGPDVEWIDSVDYPVDPSRRAAFARAIRAYYPCLDEERLQPGYSGIRPKLVGPGGGAADFILQGPREHGAYGLVNLYGIESPGLTASAGIGDGVRDLIGPA